MFILIVHGVKMLVMKTLSNDNIKKIISDGKSMGYDLRITDIFYTFATQWFSDCKSVYVVLFGKTTKEEEITSYDSSKKIVFLKKYIKANFLKEESKSAKHDSGKEQFDDISFEENKAYMLKLKRETEEAIQNGDIDKKDGLKILADLSVKLNDKFAVSEKQDEQRIQVLTKFNTICPHTRKECWVQTKEYAMEHWGLIEKNNEQK